MSKEINQKYNILVVDDERLIRESLYEILRIEGFKAHMASSAEEALNTLAGGQAVDLIVTDLKLPQSSGISLLEEVKKDYPAIEVIIITGFGTIESAVEAMKKGAYDYVTKPINDEEIKMVIRKIVEKKEILEENRSLKEQVAESSRDFFCGMIGQSKRMQKVYHIIESVASSNATILITGESGTGKGMTARAIHQTDGFRNDKPFVEVSCGALSETLLESELFGHVKGAFTGAVKDKVGRFEYARNGTIFLDEIDAFSPALQVKLLRVLQDGTYERVGDNETRKTEARIIVATNRDLQELVKEGDFREDLFYRINVISVHLPPLRDRKDDLGLLAENFLRKFGTENKKNVMSISPELKKIFSSYEWPGNIREFENALEGAVIMAKTEVLQKWDLPNLSKFTSSAPVKVAEGASLKRGLEDPEKEMIVSVLEKHQWNRNKAADALGINRTTLYNKMKKYKIFEKEKN